MKRALVIALLAVCSSCKPFVETESYYCGPNRSCPPDQVCDDPTYTCTSEVSLAESFRCPDGSQDAEPDDTREQAIGLGETVCGEVLTSSDIKGCIIDEGDDDIYRFEHAAVCERNNRALIQITFPAAFVHLSLHIVDASGATVATGADCTAPNDRSGRFSVCAEVDLQLGEYFVEISPRLGEGVDCSGRCRNNEYELDVFLPT